MPDLFLLFSHSTTPVQEEQARQILGVQEIIAPPSVVRSLWSELSAEADMLRPLLEPVTTWLANTSKEGDYVLIHGDFGACYLVVQYCLASGLVPIYSTTERKAIETQLENGTIQLTHTFCHVRYRLYGK